MSFSKYFFHLLYVVLKKSSENSYLRKQVINQFLGHTSFTNLTGVHVPRVVIMSIVCFLEVLE